MAENVGVAHETVAAYGAHARAYRDGTRDLPGNVRVDLDDFAAAVGEGGRVLEIGSGGGRDAEFLEHHGLSIRRTDVTPAFVDLLRADGYAADVLDPLTDDLADPTRSGEMYDAVWANACLLHVAREDLPAVLARLREVTRPGAACASRSRRARARRGPRTDEWPRRDCSSSGPSRTSARWSKGADGRW